MQYHIRFSDSDLRSDIRSRLEKELGVESSPVHIPYLTQEEINDYVAQAIEQIKQEGNSALYHGLVLKGTQIALDKIRESH